MLWIHASVLSQTFLPLVHVTGYLFRISFAGDISEPSPFIPFVFKVSRLQWDLFIAI